MICDIGDLRPRRLDAVGLRLRCGGLCFLRRLQRWLLFRFDQHTLARVAPLHVSREALQTGEI